MHWYDDYSKYIEKLCQGWQEMRTIWGRGTWRKGASRDSAIVAAIIADPAIAAIPEIIMISKLSLLWRLVYFWLWGKVYGKGVPLPPNPHHHHHHHWTEYVTWVSDAFPNCTPLPNIWEHEKESILTNEKCSIKVDPTCAAHGVGITGGSQWEVGGLPLAEQTHPPLGAGS